MASFRQLIEQLLSEYDRVISENLSLKEDLKGMAGIHTPRSSSSSRSPSGIPCESDSPITAMKNDLRPSSRFGPARTSWAPSDIPSEPDTPINARKNELATIPLESVSEEVSKVRDPGLLLAPAADEESNLDVEGFQDSDQHQVVSEAPSMNISKTVPPSVDAVCKEIWERSKEQPWPSTASLTVARTDSESADGVFVTQLYRIVKIFWAKDNELLEPFASCALTYTELTTLDRSTFMELLKTHTENCPELRTKVRQFCCWLAFQRAFIVEAKSRLARTAGAFI
mmetsp:Transcript_77507/g.217554  ORF Transcript_77507/g.217554 Transcript_77507/m.217554 type:complete len:284 (-) Transcript_77507:73-924(-)